MSVATKFTQPGRLTAISYGMVGLFNKNQLIPSKDSFFKSENPSNKPFPPILPPEVEKTPRICTLQEAWHHFFINTTMIMRPGRSYSV